MKNIQENTEPNPFSLDSTLSWDSELEAFVARGIDLGLDSFNLEFYVDGTIKIMTGHLKYLELDVDILDFIHNLSKEATELFSQRG